jgi:hypothetical protein
LAGFRTGDTSGFLTPAATRHQVIRKRCLAWFRTGALLCLCLLCAHASAQILDTLDVSQKGGTAVIEAHFSRPVFYVRHFPPEFGDTLQIYLQVPVVLSEPGQREIPVRKSIKAPPVDHLPLQDVTYEGTGVEGPRLIIRFTRPVHYSIEKGHNDRSIKIIVPLGAAPTGSRPSGVAAKHYAVTIVPSLTTPPNMVDVKRKLKKQFPNGVVYPMRATVFGKTVDLVRLGFFLRARRQPQCKRSSHQFIPCHG